MISCILLFGCDKGKPGATKITLYIESAYHKHVLLEQVAMNKEPALLLDSSFVKTGLDTIVLYVPKGEERLCQLKVEDSRMQVYVITDTKDITVNYNYSTGRYSFEGSPASNSLKTFREGQVVIATQTRDIKAAIDSLKTNHASKKLIDSANHKLDLVLAGYFKRNFSFADTVHSPAAFLATYNTVDFDTDYQGLKKFINAAGQRFPNHTGVQALKKSTLDYIAIFEKQYVIGDVLPELILPDQNGKNFSTYSTKGKYLLLDFWATWCDQCIKYAEAKKKLAKLFPANKMEIVSVAIDDNKAVWQNIIAQEKYSWAQLIDEKMWEGVAFKTIKFDSIPYNFLISPEGRIVKKAIKADSMVLVISAILK